MSYNKTLSAILRGEWLIEPQFAQQNMPLVVNMLSGKQANFGLTEKQTDENAKSFSPVPFDAVMSTQAYGVSYYTDFDRIPEGSIAIVQLYGPVLKYGDMCSYGMLDKATLLNRIATSGKFKSVLLDVDSPGGQASGTQLLAGTIKNLSIPVYAVVNDGMMASAAMWIGSACQEIFATTLTDTFGSIGVYTTLYDFNAYLAKEGIPVHEIYADQSTDKNKGYRDAINNDYKAIKEGINFLATSFIAAVTENRGDRLNITKSNPFTGKMFTATEALEIGLIDGIKSFSEVLSIANSSDEQPRSKSKSENNMFNKFPKLTALKGVAVASISQDHLNEVNTEMSDAGVQGLTISLDSEVKSGQNAIGKVSNLEATNLAQEAKITELTSKVTELEGTVAAQKIKLGAPSDDPKTPKNGKEDTTLETKEETETYMTSVDKRAKKYMEDY